MASAGCGSDGSFDAATGGPTNGRGACGGAVAAAVSTVGTTIATLPLGRDGPGGGSAAAGIAD
jgi:hypothetical protein